MFDGTRTTRRRLVAGTVALGLGGLGTQSGAGAAQPATPAAGANRLVAHKYGATEIGGVPERIVTVGDSDHDPVLALGVVPVAVRNWHEGRVVYPWNAAVFGGLEPSLVPADSINFEQIAALRPDLILGVFSGLTEDEYRTLASIAPTVAQPAAYVDWGVPWQDQTRIVGRALGRESRAEEAVAAVEALFAAGRRAHPEFTGAHGVVASSYDPGKYNVHGAEDPRSRFLAALGFRLPPKIAPIVGDAISTELSRERLDLLDTDLVVWFLATGGRRQDLETDPIYARLAIAREGRAVYMEASDDLAVALGFATVLSLPYALDAVPPLLTAALDGDPATSATPAR